MSIRRAGRLRKRRKTATGQNGKLFFSLSCPRGRTSWRQASATDGHDGSFTRRMALHVETQPHDRSITSPDGQTAPNASGDSELWSATSPPPSWGAHCPGTPPRRCLQSCDPRERISVSGILHGKSTSHGDPQSLVSERQHGARRQVLCRLTQQFLIHLKLGFLCLPQSTLCSNSTSLSGLDTQLNNPRNRKLERDFEMAFWVIFKGPD